MASSDEEGEIIPVVTSYWFENEKEDFVSLCSLTLLFSISETECDLGEKVFLRGTTDDSLQKIYKQITGWRFELTYEQPEISVLSKDRNWITLQRPRECFESTIRTILVTVYFLHFLRRNPEESQLSIWDKLKKAFSAFDIIPSVNDILNHVSLMREAVKRDKDLAKSKPLCEVITIYLKGIIEGCFGSSAAKLTPLILGNPRMFILQCNQNLLWTQDEENVQSDELNLVGEQNIGYDTVCSICDNGGEILPCEGSCLRSFHATKEAGIDAFCESLGYTTAQVKAFPNFYCQNCKYKQHQCFACGKLGSSDVSSKAEAQRLSDGLVKSQPCLMRTI
ncbi:hypothetical protein LR48_Vigan11g160000 [Vigna angularis]|uniref:RFTS domain-containing protein n=1 Tax=Phaseolus angularis TaxID=3914 RepID=A0A0L9VU11_PHAAN|nr:hypothetical protein LR48_Vigan11g160000 [Vigna angularis]